MQSRPFSFEGTQGYTLSGALDVPDGDIRAYALFAHCFTCSKDFVASRKISEALANRGIATLRFDFTGLGHSEGEFANTDFTSNVADLIAAANALAEKHEGPKILIGHSLGGAATMAAAPYIESATAVATIGAPFDPAHVTHMFHDSLHAIKEKGEAEVSLAGRPFRIRQEFVHDIEQQHLRASLRAMRKALLVLHSPLDDTVHVDNARMIYEAAKHPKSFISLDGVDHLMTRRRDAEYVADILSTWSNRYINVKPRKPRLPNRTARPDDSVRVGPSGAGDFGQIMAVRGHTVLADEPLNVGGEDSGPTPYDLLLMAVGSCTAMTIRMYARHKKWPLDDVRVELTQRRVHVEDCADCETPDAKHHEISRKITLRGDLSDEQRQRIFAIADKCPVHKTLEGDVRIVSELRT